LLVLQHYERARHPPGGTVGRISARASPAYDFCNSGSEANETALKVIRAWQKLRGKSNKTKILSRTYSYHGVTLATTSMTGLPGCYQPFDLPLPGFIHVPGPNPYGANSPLDPWRMANGCIEETAHVIKREGAETIAAMFVEPVQGAGGVIVPPMATSLHFAGFAATTTFCS
jgi:adenosylmethionine-8-amino-7-oxononanoate aminotransferase